jgi:hypothetical protein
MTDIWEAIEKGLEIGGITGMKSHNAEIAHVLFRIGVKVFVCILRVIVDLMLAYDNITLHEYCQNRYSFRVTLAMHNAIETDSRC